MADEQRTPLDLRKSGIDEFLSGEPNVTGYLSQQNRRNVTALVKRNRRTAAIRVTELFVRAFLPNLFEA